MPGILMALAPRVSRLLIIGAAVLGCAPVPAIRVPASADPATLQAQQIIRSSADAMRRVHVEVATVWASTKTTVVSSPGTTVVDQDSIFPVVAGLDGIIQEVLVGLDETVQLGSALAIIRPDTGDDARRHEIRAPAGGRIFEQRASVGRHVAAAERLFSIADFAELSMTVSVPESEVQHAVVGLRVEVAADGVGRRFSGHITSLAQIDPPGRKTATIGIKVDDPSGTLRIGMIARAALAGDATHRHDSLPVLMLPRDALQQVNGDTVVFVPVGPDEYRVQPVTVADVFGGQAAVSAGLRAGESVVTSGSRTLAFEATTAAR